MHNRKLQSLTASRMILMMLILCMVCSVGCAKEIQTVVIAPPGNLLEPCQEPTMPPELMNTSDLKEYAKAATKGLALYGASFGECNGRIEALRTWRKQATASEK